jgi:hypothetical protein
MRWEAVRSAILQPTAALTTVRLLSGPGAKNNFALRPALRVAVPALAVRNGKPMDEAGRSVRAREAAGDGLSPKIGCASARMLVIGSGCGNAATKPTARSAHCLEAAHCAPDHFFNRLSHPKLLLWELARTSGDR